MFPQFRGVSLLDSGVLGLGCRGWVRPPVRRRSPRHLSLTEREEISMRIAGGEPLCALLAGWDELHRPSRGSWLVTVAVWIIGPTGLIGWRGGELGGLNHPKLASNVTLRQVVANHQAAGELCNAPQAKTPTYHLLVAYSPV